MITANGEHSGSINDLAARGVIKPIKFILDEICYEANSVWAATGWLKNRGYYSQRPPSPIRWLLDGESL